MWKGYANGYGEKGEDNPILYKNVDGKLQPVSGETGDKDTEGEQDQDSGPGMNIKSNPMDKEGDEGKEKTVN